MRLQGIRTALGQRCHEVDEPFPLRLVRRFPLARRHEEMHGHALEQQDLGLGLLWNHQPCRVTREGTVAVLRARRPGDRGDHLPDELARHVLEAR